MKNEKLMDICVSLDIDFIGNEFYLAPP